MTESGARDDEAAPAVAPEPLAGWITASEASHRLGVKKETLYAYVSRGMLTSRRRPAGRESRFDPAEVARLAERKRSGGRAGALEVVIDSGLTFLDPAGRLFYRGWDVELACRQARFEDVAEWLWTAPAGGEPRVRARDFEAPAAVMAAARAATGSLSPSARPVERLRVAVAAADTADGLRFDRRPDAVAAAGRRIISVLVDGSLPLNRSPQGRSVAERLWSCLSVRPGTAEQVQVLNAALVLLADHEMASSTLAARVAASTWANPYLVVSAGLAILGGPLHGGVGDRVVPVLREVSARGATDVIGERWRLGEAVAGFGHMVYTDRDPRGDALLVLIEQAWPNSPAVVAARDVIATVTAHGATFPNVDLALAALVYAAGMIEGSAEAIFAVARTAGWLGHAIEEYEHRLRFRLRAAYTGPAPRSAVGPASSGAAGTRR